jgi:hypothetical protein
LERLEGLPPDPASVGFLRPLEAPGDLHGGGEERRPTLADRTQRHADGLVDERTPVARRRLDVRPRTPR